MNSKTGTVCSWSEYYFVTKHWIIFLFPYYHSALFLILPVRAGVIIKFCSASVWVSFFILLEMKKNKNINGSLLLSRFVFLDVSLFLYIKSFWKQILPWNHVENKKYDDFFFSTYVDIIIHDKSFNFYPTFINAPQTLFCFLSLRDAIEARELKEKGWWWYFYSIRVCCFQEDGKIKN